MWLRYSILSMEILEKDAAPRNVVIVGAGASGLLAAIALLRSGSDAVVLVEQDATWSAGPAYATTDPGHLLNVPAGNLSCDPSRPDHFAEWASTKARGVTAASFLPRRLFGEYLRASLDEAAQQHAGPGALARVTAEAVAVDDDGAGPDAPRVRVAIRPGRWIVGAHLVLALGNPPSRRLTCRVGTVIDDPWSACSSDRIGRDDAVVIVGVGLSAVDVALTLAGRGHRGPIRMVSRHGLLPQPHAERRAPAVSPGVLDVPTARGAVAWLRRAVASAGGDWRAAFDAIRPVTNETWRRLPEHERARLLRHTARHWEVHRHRMPPDVAAAFDALVASGRVEVALGDAGCGERLAAMEAKWIVNCTGPEFDVRAWRSPIVEDLLASGLARPGPLGLGLDVDADGSLLDGSGHAAPAISVVGPLRRGVEWETTAIPELRVQADAVARRVAGESARRAQVAKSGWAPRGASARPFGSSQSSWRPSAVRSRK